MMPKRSNCPISNVLDLVGDKWSLLILRDLTFFGKCTYSELQTSDEKMATNILSNRLERLELDGLISKEPDKRDKRRKVYRLTQAGLDMMPIMLEMMIWSSTYEPVTNTHPEVVERAKNDRENLIKDLLAMMKDREV
ncbi:helix-turn-helix domain-containing protein [Vibrio hannami]|uniref:winged helix-turn-helix transcriptional regulator n=1 Tax=Vibrio hannami TaxID=2717094 RepID=UPI00240EB119|nr:helix-turn-helix domain-containing protein [Vibrio hannami]MDG3086473.1 helix-turn-helix domain-containing protein [Vibrio hannami]